MSMPLIEVAGVRKKFCRSLKRSLWYGATDLAHELSGRQHERTALRRDEFWALDDISFELHRGDSLGLIGANGAGKTTLLRMLSGLIRPDAGRISVRGRLQALIALGAGFSPVLSGRENIYVNGAVLGMTRAQIDRRLDEIVAFAGIGAALDAPVQSYSSGMVVRLGFAVAIHMEPDILLVDEVLAVGDMAFRARCARKLGELKEQGVPWILVSHDMGTIRNQTNKALVLERGRCRFQGDPGDAIAQYMLSVSGDRDDMVGAGADSHAWQDADEREARIAGVSLQHDGEPCASFATGDSLEVRIDYEAREQLKEPAVGIAFYGGDGTCYTGTNTATSGFGIDHLSGRGTLRFRMDHLPFLPGLYRVRVDLHDRHMGVIDSLPTAAHLRVTGGSFAAGLFAPAHSWALEPAGDGQP
jgi:lipopolysaccharide transport system ATP-binding protein